MQILIENYCLPDLLFGVALWLDPSLVQIMETDVELFWSLLLAHLCSSELQPVSLLVDIIFSKIVSFNSA